ncbi:MAG: aminopeptidase P family protein [Clostridia bacterium]|nr:aminopeptidase P family protein [Clostridia bacterium]
MSALSRLREKMKARGVDALIVLDELNQRYLSGFAFTDGLLLITAKEAHLVTDFRYYEMALSGAYSDFTVHDIKFEDERRGFISGILSDNGCKTVGFEGQSISFASYSYYVREFPEYEFLSIEGDIEQIRQIKTPEEISFIQKAQDITDLAFKHILSVLTPNMTEIEVAAELEYAMRRAGADGFAFDTVAVSGDASALPHGTPRNVKLKAGFLTMDYGAKYNGYCSDMTRTVVIGRADAEMKKLYNTVLNAQRAGLDFLRAGVDCGEADKAARDIIDACYKGTFGHSLGHSVGLFIHESPALSPRAFGRLVERGNILTVEPGIYLFGKYGCRIEDMVAVEDEGVYNFTHSPKELIEIY